MARSHPTSPVRRQILALITSLIALSVVVVCIVVVLQRPNSSISDEDTTSNIDEVHERVFAFDASSVQSITVTQERERLLLERSVDEWTVRQQITSLEWSEPVAARSEKIEDMLQRLEDVRATGGIIGEVSQERLEDYGFGRTAVRIEIEVTSEEDTNTTHGITFGETTFDGIRAYAQSSQRQSTDVALVPVATRSVSLVSYETLAQGTGEARRE